MRLLAFAHRAAEGRFGSTASGASNDSTHVHPDSHPFANLPKKRGLSLLGEAGGVGEKDTSRCAASREQCADRKEEGGECDDECVAARIMMRRTNAAKRRRDRQSQKEDGIIAHANDYSFTAGMAFRNK